MHGKLERRSGAEGMAEQAELGLDRFNLVMFGQLVQGAEAVFDNRFRAHLPLRATAAGIIDEQIAQIRIAGQVDQR